MKSISSAAMAVLCAILLSAPAAVADCPSVLFTTQQTRSDGSNAISSVVSVDYDNDGKLDLVGLIEQTNVSGSGTLSAWHGVGDGTFAAPVSLGDTNLSEVTLADINNDGRKDLLMIGSYTIVIRLGNGAGFNSAITKNVDFYASHLVAAQFDGDSALDLIATSAGSNYVTIYHGDGAGNFTLLRRVSGATFAFAVAAADFDGDGRTDIAYGHLNSNNIDVLFQNADGSLTAPLSLQSGPAVTGNVTEYPTQIVAADLNEDGQPDIVMTNWEDSGPAASVVIQRNTGSRTFSRSTLTPGIYHGSSDFTSLSILDVNGDGHLDVLAGALNGGQMMTFAGKGDGTFYSPTYYSPGTSIFSITTGDFDADGDIDAAIGGYQKVVTAKGSCDTQLYLFSRAPVITTGQSAPLRALVSGISTNTPEPRGSVTFKEGATVLGTGDIDVAGTAALDLSGLSVGNHTVTATFGTSTSQNITQKVTASTTTTTINFPVAQSVYGTPYTLTVTIRNSSNSTIYGYFTLNVDGVETEKWSGASFSLNLTPGAHTITASFVGDVSYPPSTSGPQNITTLKATPSIANSGGALSVRLGEAHSLQFTVAGPNGYSTPTGSVQLKRGSTLLGSGTLSNGVATVSATLERGAHDVTALYSGDSNYNAASMNLTLSVLPNQTLAIDARGLTSSISIRAVLPANTTSMTLYRSVSGANTFAPVTWTQAGEYDSSSPVRGVLYDYKLVVIAGGVEQTSNIDSALLFTDDPALSQTTVIKRTHFDELRLLINAQRAVAGLAAFNFDSSYNDSIVKASHLTGLQTALSEARAALGMVAASYTETPGIGTTIKATHVQELRDQSR